MLGQVLGSADVSDTPERPGDGATLRDNGGPHRGGARYPRGTVPLKWMLAGASFGLAME